jgi:two-component system cell cycle sensor histidine kinase/response regulator CckA
MSEAPADHRQCILVVDDEFHNRQLLEVMLAREGCLVLTAGSGEEALAMVALRPPDLIILDVMMPGLDGFEVTRRLKGDVATKSIPIIILTARDGREARMRGLNAGAEEFIGLPVDHAELCARVRNLLRLKAFCDYHDRYSQLLEGEVGSRAAELVASERLYRSTFDAAPVGIAHVGLDGRWLRVNQRLCDLLGYAQGELSGVAAQELLQSPGEVESWRQMAAGTTDRCVAEEKQFRRPDGGLVWARVNASVHRDGQGHPLHFIAVIEDITERRELEAQVRQASRMDAIGQLASGVAHDFNNLLSVVISYSEMLAADMPEGDPMRADLGEIRGAGLRAADLTRQLLAFSRKQVLQPRSVDLNEVLLGMEKMLRRLIGENVQLTATRLPALRKVLVDPGQMEQVIMNLAVNARDAMPRGGRLTLETAEQHLDEAFCREHAGVKPGPHIVLTVADSGTGMDGPTLARMFEPFFTTKEVGKGTGLGLATVFGIVRQSGGTITVRSEPGAGTTFKVFIPAQDQEAAARPSSLAPAHPTLGGTETILLVEDEERVRNLVRTILCRLGYSVLDAQGGGDALLLCEQHPGVIDLLVTDVVMPRMSGRQLAERLLTIRPGLRVLYMSGYTDDIVVRHGALDSTICFLQKPITPDSLGRAVREALDVAGRA